jgi:cytochrome b
MKTGGPAHGNSLVWDLPLRLCHWGFAGSLSASLFLGLYFDPESEIFHYHMPLGLLAGWFVALRLALGFSGSRPTRWPAFFHAPARTLRYFSNVLRGRADEAGPLNPGSAHFALGIYLGLFGLIATGFAADWIEPWHGRLADGIIVLIACHLAGLTLHALRHRACTPLAMIHGRAPAQPGEPPAPARRPLGLTLLLASALVTWLVFRHYDSATSTLALPFLPAIDFPLIQKG